MINFGRFACVCLAAMFLSLVVATPIANQYLRVNGPEWLTQGKVTTSYVEVLKEVPAHYPPGSKTLKWVTEEIETKTQDRSNLDCASWFFVLTSAALASCFAIMFFSSFEQEKKTITMAA